MVVHCQCGVYSSSGNYPQHSCGRYGQNNKCDEAAFYKRAASSITQCFPQEPTEGDFKACYERIQANDCDASVSRQGQYQVCNEPLL